MYHIVVVPDGLQADDKGNTTDKPSFVYRAVLDAVLDFYTTHADTVIYLAPANAFGGMVPEHISAKMYLVQRGVMADHIITCTPQLSTYIDTMGNAVFLKQHLCHNNIPVPTCNSHLFVAKYHTRRAGLCFTHCGFKFDKIHSIQYATARNESIVNRLFYYRYPVLHRVYEMLAYVRDYMRILCNKI